MTITLIFQFLFPKSICTESAEKFRSLQISRFAKAGISINQQGVQRNNMMRSAVMTAQETNEVREEFSDPLMEKISQIKSDLETIISPLSLAV